MIELTGLWDGKMVENKPVSAHELIEEFGIPINPEKPYIQFDLDDKVSGVIAVNRADGKLRFAERRMLQPVVNGNIGNRHVTIRYYETKINQGNNMYKYGPERLFFYGKSQVVNLQDSLEQAVMLFLNPHCGDSPLKNPNRYIPYYRIAVLEQRAADNLAYQKRYSSIRDRIMNSEDDFIIRVALGINATNRAIPQDQASNPVLARVALLELAGKNLEMVESAFDSKAIQVAGIVMKCIRDGDVKYGPGANGQTKWLYAEKHGGGVITTCPPKSNINEALIDYLLNPNFFSAFLQKIFKSADLSESVPNSEPVTINFDDPKEVVKIALERKLLHFHPIEEKVYIMEDGQFQDKAFKVIKKGKETWREELLESANESHVNRLKKFLI